MRRFLSVRDKNSDLIIIHIAASLLGSKLKLGPKILDFLLSSCAELLHSKKKVLSVWLCVGVKKSERIIIAGLLVVCLLAGITSRIYAMAIQIIPGGEWKCTVISCVSHGSMLNFVSECTVADTVICVYM